MWKVLFILVALGALPAKAWEIQKVVSVGGITAWLVEDHSRPLLALSASFGKAPDPQKYSGSSAMMAALLDQGAADLNWQTFQNELEKFSIKLSFHTSHDFLSAKMMTLTKPENKKRAFELLAMALARPSFTPNEIEKVRTQQLSLVNARQQNVASFAREQFKLHAFAPHPYAYPVDGTAASLPKIKRSLLRRLHKKIITRGNLHISVVGAIDAASLAILLDEVFAPLPKTAPRTKSKPIKLRLRNKKPLFIQRQTPQSYLYFAFPGVKRSHPDFIPYYVMSHILGSGQNSRLFKMARERFGLVYSIYTYPLALRQGGFIIGSAATRNSQRKDLLRLIRKIITTMRARGISAAELERAKTYIIGSYGLNFDTSLAVASNLTFIQNQRLGIDYIQQRETLIKALTPAVVNRQVNKFLNYDKMAIVIVGGKDATKARNLSR